MSKGSSKPDPPTAILLLSSKRGLGLCRHLSGQRAKDPDKEMHTKVKAELKSFSPTYSPDLPSSALCPDRKRIETLPTQAFVLGDLHSLHVCLVCFLNLCSFPSLRPFLGVSVVSLGLIVSGEYSQQPAMSTVVTGPRCLIRVFYVW